MFVEITAVRPGPTGPVVEFRAEAGAGVATWHGRPPEVGREYLVELDVPETLVWDETILPGSPAAPGVAAVGGRAYLCGPLEAYTDDGVAAVRVGTSVVMVETEGSPFAVGTRVLLSVGALHLYDVTPGG
jgi:hypothetical protein